MPTHNLFSLQEQGDAGWAHGRAFATGNASASASFNRGIDLSAGVDIQGELGGEIGDGVEASLSAGGTLTGGLSFRAGYPLDLFSEAGLVARLRAQAAAAAFLRAQIELDSEVFAGLLRDKFSGPWLELVEIFLTEVKIGAGLWGSASVSAQLLAEAAIVGNFLSSGGSPAGFTCSFQYAAGFGFGTGMDLKANFGLSNPRRLLDRLSDQLTAILEREIQEVLPDLVETERALAQQSLPLLRLVMPLVFRAIYEEGIALTQPSNKRKNAASNSIIWSVLREAQEMLTRRLFELAISKLNSFLESDEVAETIRNLAGETAANAVTALLNVRSGILDLAEFDPTSQDWMKIVLKFIDAFAALSSLIPGADREAWNKSLALSWSAAVVAGRLIAWATTPADSERPFDPAAPVALPSNSFIVSYVATRLKKSPGVGLTFGDAIDFLLLDQTSWLQSLNAIPEIKPVLDLLSTIFQGSSTGTLIQVLFKDLASFSEDKAGELLGKMIAALGPVIENQILPQLFDPLEANADEGVQKILKQVVRPTLLSLTKIILPRINTLDADNTAQALREQISSVLLQSLTRFILVSTEILVDHAATEGPKALRQLSESLRAGGGGPFVDGAMVVLAQSVSMLSGLGIVPLLLTPTRDDLIDMVEMSAETIEFWNNHERDDWFRLIESITSLGLMTGDAALDSLWQSIESSDPQKPVPTVAVAVQEFAVRMGSSVWELVKFLADKLLALVRRHFERLAVAVVQAFADAARTAVEAVRQAAVWLDQQIDWLKRQIGQLVEDIKAAIADIAGKLRALAEHLISLIDRAVEAVRAIGWQLVRGVLFENDVFKLLPDDVENWVINSIKALYDAAFDAIKWLLELPLQMFRSAALWVQEGLTHQAQAGTLSRDNVISYVRERARSLSAQALSLPIAFDVVVEADVPVFGKASVSLGKIDLGTIVLPAADVLGALVGTLLGDGVLSDTINDVVSNQNVVMSKSNQINALQVSLQDALTKDEANNALDNLTTGQPLGVDIPDIVDGRTYRESAPFHIVLKGANRTFVTGVLGIPSRVKILVNGEEYRYAATSWNEVSGGLEYRAKLVRSDAGLAPLPLLPPGRYLPVELPPGLRLEAIIESNRPPRFRAVMPDQSPPITPEIPPVPIPFQPDNTGPFGLSGDLPPLQSLEPVPLFPGREDLLTAIRERLTFPVVDPFTGSEFTPPAAVDELTPVIVQQVQLSNASPYERMRGFRLAQPDDMLKTFDEMVESILARPGLNHIEVIVVDGSGAQQVSAGRTFFLAKGKTR